MNGSNGRGSEGVVSKEVALFFLLSTTLLIFSFTSFLQSGIRRTLEQWYVVEQIKMNMGHLHTATKGAEEADDPCIRKKLRAFRKIEK